MSLADEKQTAKCLWYGIPGTGKTTDLASVANRGKLYVVEAEAGLKRTPLEQLKINTKNIEPYREITYGALDGLFWDLKGELEDDPDSLVGVGFDSLTEITKLFIDTIVEDELDKRLKKAEKRGEDPGEVNPFFVERDYYQTLTQQMRKLIRKYRDLPCHLGFTALERRDVDEDTGKVGYGPAVNPALQGDLTGYVDVIAYCRTDGAWPKGYEVAGAPGDDIMVADMRATPKYQAKDRFHVTPRVMVNPTFERIIDYINGELSPDGDEQQKAYRELWAERKKEQEDKERARAERKAATSQSPTKKAAERPPTKAAQRR